MIDSNTKAVGNIDKNKKYNGLIKFYNTKEDFLFNESFYLDNIQNGKSVSYYPNGKVHSIVYYTDDKLNGTSTFFNTEGRMYATNFYYYGLKAGPATFLENGVLKRYSFYSLENELLFRIDYDSVQGKKITDMERHFFNFHLNQADEFYEGKITVNEQLCFLYLLNPPKYRFNYSLVQIDRSYNVLSVLQEFESVNPWVKFKIKPEFSTTSRVALKLNIYDSINGMEGEMFKVIDN